MPECHSIVLSDAKTIIYITNDERFSISRISHLNKNFTNLGAGMKEVLEIRVTKQSKSGIDFTLKFIPERWESGAEPEMMTTEFTYSGSYLIEW